MTKTEHAVALWTWCEMPFYECPRCDATWQADEFYLDRVGDVLMCPSCERYIEIAEEEVTMRRLLRPAQEEPDGQT
jgi:hypothetical protein